MLIYAEDDEHFEFELRARTEHQKSIGCRGYSRRDEVSNIATATRFRGSICHSSDGTPMWSDAQRGILRGRKLNPGPRCDRQNYQSVYYHWSCVPSGTSCACSHARRIHRGLGNAPKGVKSRIRILRHMYPRCTPRLRENASLCCDIGACAIPVRIFEFPTKG